MMSEIFEGLADVVENAGGEASQMGSGISPAVGPNGGSVPDAVAAGGGGGANPGDVLEADGIRESRIQEQAGGSFAQRVHRTPGF